MEATVAALLRRQIGRVQAYKRNCTLFLTAELRNYLATKTHPKKKFILLQHQFFTSTTFHSNQNSDQLNVSVPSHRSPDLPFPQIKLAIKHNYSNFSNIFLSPHERIFRKILGLGNFRGRHTNSLVSLCWPKIQS